MLVPVLDLVVVVVVAAAAAVVAVDVALAVDVVVVADRVSSSLETEPTVSRPRQNPNLPFST